MRPASIGPVKALMRRTDLSAIRALYETAKAQGAENFRPALMDWLASHPE